MIRYDQLRAAPFMAAVLIFLMRRIMASALADAPIISKPFSSDSGGVINIRSPVWIPASAGTVAEEIVICAFPFAAILSGSMLTSPCFKNAMPLFKVFAPCVVHITDPSIVALFDRNNDRHLPPLVPISRVFGEPGDNCVSNVAADALPTPSINSRDICSAGLGL